MSLHDSAACLRNRAAGVSTDGDEVRLRNGQSGTLLHRHAAGDADAVRAANGWSMGDAFRMYSRCGNAETGVWADGAAVLPGPVPSANCHAPRVVPAGCAAADSLHCAGPAGGQTELSGAGDGYVPEVVVRKVPVTVTKMVCREVVQKIPYKVCRMTTETKTERIPYQVCQMVTEQRVREIPCTVTKMVTETQTRKVPYCTTKKMPYTSTRKVCRVVPREVSTKATRLVARQVMKKVPVTRSVLVPETICCSGVCGTGSAAVSASCPSGDCRTGYGPARQTPIPQPESQD